MMQNIEIFFYMKSTKDLLKVGLIYLSRQQFLINLTYLRLLNASGGKK